MDDLPILAQDTVRCEFCKLPLPRTGYGVRMHMRDHGKVISEGEARQILTRPLSSPPLRQTPDESLPFNLEIPSQLGRSR